MLGDPPLNQRGWGCRQVQLEGLNVTFTAILCAPLRTAGQRLELNTPGLSLMSHNYLCKAGKKEKFRETRGGGGRVARGGGGLSLVQGRPWHDLLKADFGAGADG